MRHGRKPRAAIRAQIDVPLERERPVVGWINLGKFFVVRRLHGDAAATATVRDIRDVTHCELPDDRLVLEADSPV